MERRSDGERPGEVLKMLCGLRRCDEEEAGLTPGWVCDWLAVFHSSTMLSTYCEPSTVSACGVEFLAGETGNGPVSNAPSTEATGKNLRVAHEKREGTRAVFSTRWSGKASLGR